MSSKHSDIAVVDLFCGVGGLTHGFLLEGFNVIAGIDIDASCRYAYEKNNDARFIQQDIRDVTGDEISKLYPKRSIKVLVGCAPCQPFSTYARKRKRDEKWRMLNEFSRIIDKVKPDVVSMENVPQLKGPRGARIFKRFVKRLENKGYAVWCTIIYCPDYGVPQTRKRLVLFASRFGQLKMIEATHSKDNYSTVMDAIGDLEPIKAGEVSSTDPLHVAARLSPLNLKRIRKTPYGGSWKDWDIKLRLKCHRKKTGHTFSGVYGRMVWEKPGPTITTQCKGLGNGRFGHPKQDRALSIREAALLQTFPLNYELIDPTVDFSIKNIAKHIGNAVPIQLSCAIAKSIKKHLDDYNG